MLLDPDLDLVSTSLDLLSQARLDEARSASEGSRESREEAFRALSADYTEAITRAAAAEGALEGLKER